MNGIYSYLPLVLGIGLLLSLVPLNVLHIRILRYLFRGDGVTWDLNEMWSKGKTYAATASAYRKGSLDDGALQDLFRRYRRAWRVTLGLFAAFIVAIVVM